MSNLSQLRADMDVSPQLEMGDTRKVVINSEKVWLSRGWIPLKDKQPKEEDGMIRCCFLSNYDYIEPGMRVFEYENTVPWNGWIAPEASLKKNGNYGHTHWRKS